MKVQNHLSMRPFIHAQKSSSSLSSSYFAVADQSSSEYRRELAYQKQKQTRRRLITPACIWLHAAARRAL